MQNAGAAAAVPLEQSCLTYTLLSDAAPPDFSWSDFSLIIRSLHSFKVVSINEDPQSKTITVTVAYFANAGNARKRLGGAGEFIAVSRESTNVQREELQNLQLLRRRFGFGRDNEEEERTSSKPSKKRRYANVN